MNGMPHTVNRVLGLISANFSRSAITVNRISEGVCSQQGLYTTYTYIRATLQCPRENMRHDTIYARWCRAEPLSDIVCTVSMSLGTSLNSSISDANCTVRFL